MRELHIWKSRAGGGTSPAPRLVVHPRGSRRLPLAGFTLLELMVVLGIMGLMAWLTIPALSSLKSSGGLNASAAAVQSILTQARAQAMLSDSHVFVGFYESDASQADTVRPAPTGVGRLWIGVALTKDGTQGYDLTNAASWSASNLTPVGKLRFFDNLHLATNATFYLSSGTSNTVSPVGDPSVTNTPFGWPLENSNSVTQFISGVIQFTPQGAAMLPGSTIPEYIQLALIPTHGTLIASNLPNAAVIQVDAITGAMRTFRP